MIPLELRLQGLGHCNVHLPRKFLDKESSVKPGSIISIRSVQSDVEVAAIWNGNLTIGDEIVLDLKFGQANGLQEGLVVAGLITINSLADCIECRAEVIKATDYGMISEHLFANVLDRCRLIYNDLVLPIWLSEHVIIFVKVTSISPANDYVMLTKWTEMQFVNSIDSKDIANKEEGEQCVKEIHIQDPIAFVSYALGLGYLPKVYPGPLLVQGDKGSGKTHFLKSLSKRYEAFHCEIYNCKQLRGKRYDNIKKIIGELVTGAIAKQPSIIALDDVDSIIFTDPKHDDDKGSEVLYRKRIVDYICQTIKQLERLYHSKNQNVLLILTCKSLESLEPRFAKQTGRKYYGNIIKIEEPNLEDRLNILFTLLSQQKYMRFNEPKIKLDQISQRCNSFMPADLKRLVERAVIIACSRSRSEFSTDPLSIEIEDLNQAINDYTPTNLRSVALKPKSGKTLDDVGGMQELKVTLRKTILLPIKYPKLFERFPIRPQTSVLLYGPPGCGKTLIAEAITNQTEINSICVRGPELLSKYIGASEGAVRDLFKRAQLAKPCVIFFDEFESLVAKRGSDSTGVTDRVVNQFLTLMDGVEQLTSEVFIIAATSRPDLIDPAILRPGRIDKHIYCPIPDEKDRLDILKILTRKMKLKNVDLVGWSKKLDKFTGADIHSLFCSAQIKALHDARRDENQSSEGLKEGEEKRLEILVEESHILSSFDEMSGEVQAKYEILLRTYPRSLTKSMKNVIPRATLA